jgi:hypothetical protein
MDNALKLAQLILGMMSELDRLNSSDLPYAEKQASKRELAAINHQKTQELKAICAEHGLKTADIMAQAERLNNL